MKKTLAELENQAIRWQKPGFWKNEFVLQGDDGEVLARIHQPKWWSSLAEVEGVGNHWTFERKGFWRQRVEIRSAGTGDEPAVFRYNWQGTGRLEYPDGRVFHWTQGNFWGTKWAWTDADGNPLVGFQTKGSLKLSADISLDSAVESAKAPTLLIFLGWYLIVKHYEDTAAAVAAT
ncbi:MAG TPA: hypothetical protein VHO69_05905 [Phototrophicaceae bacterium]|nr:hypothetical protein [Phototrophicaceae bacterium]